MLIQFGGTNSSSSITNEVTVLDTNKVTNRMNWTFVGALDSVPALYAPILIYIPSSRATLIMGGCDQWINSNSPGNTTTHCAGFDTLYTVSSDSVLMASPKASQIRISGISPPARLMPCTVLLPDNNVLMIGGENPAVANGSLGDAWILNTHSWTWHQRSIEGFPADGIMGHSCQLAPRDQILVVGGYTGSKFVENPLSVIKMQNWSWTGHYSVPGVSTGVKVGLAMSVVVVVGAIIAGLWIRRRRNKAAALAKEQGDHPHGGNQPVKSKSGNGRRRSEVSTSGNGQRRKRSLPTRQQSVDHSREEPIELEGIESQPRTLDRSSGHANGEWDGTTRPQEPPHEQGDQDLLIDSRASQSVLASSSSTIVGPSSPVADEDDPAERDRGELGRRRIVEADQDRGSPYGHE
ncbi:hypothetical protein BGX34_004390 [Mortierella sp. NVP85]|nr:hypothetical protein BGX34_004390 [Mortierella sp. NVP85]